MCVFMSTCVCVHACLSFVESVHGLNACLCSVRACACVCVNQYVCCICVVKTSLCVRMWQRLSLYRLK